MAVLQQAYAATIPAIIPGMVINGETSNRISRTVEDAAGLAFGKFAFDGAGDHGCTGTPTAGKCLGVTIENHAGVAATIGQNADSGYAQYASAGIMPLGVMGVQASVAVARRDQVYVTPAGAITNVAGGNVIAPGWTFDNTITAAGPVAVARR